ncbi:MAG: gamma-glutamyltransferase [Sciscionella sp.]
MDRRALAKVAEKCSSSGPRGVVGTAAPEAAAIGRDAFRDGGNAFDAALAAALAETVLAPSKCGLAGDVVALCQRPGQPPKALLAIGPAAAGLAPAVTSAGALPITGGLSVGVPGAPCGYAALAELGTLGMARAIGPALELATKGFAWSVVNADYARVAHRLLAEQNPDGTVYLPGGRVIEPGTHVVAAGLARVLVEFEQRGAQLYSGPLGAALVAEVESRGGVLRQSDLDRAAAHWENASSAIVRGRRVWTTPLPTHGPSLLRALSAADGSTDAGTLWQAVDRSVRERQVAAGDPVGDGGTSVITAADALGNAVVVVHSNSHPTFASGIVVAHYDLVLSNRAGRGFSPVAGHPNFPHPARRPVTTLHAWATGPADGPAEVFGATSGGENQMPWNAQVIRRLGTGVSAQTAVLEPRWGRADRATEIEDGFAERAALAALTPVTDVPIWALQSGMQVLQVQAPLCTVTSDIRSVGGTASW